MCRWKEPREWLFPYFLACARMRAYKRQRMHFQAGSLAYPFERCRCIVREPATREEAVAKLRDEFEARLRAGAEIMTLQVPGGSNPWQEFAGIFKDDQRIDDWIESMAEYR